MSVILKSLAVLKLSPSGNILHYAAYTLMIEPTESENRRELDRFCNAFTSIHGEIGAIETGESDRTGTPSTTPPPTAAYPDPASRQHKNWLPFARLDNVQGDKNFIGTCGSVEPYAKV